MKHDQTLKSQNIVHVIAHTSTHEPFIGLGVYMYSANIYTVYRSYTDKRRLKCMTWILDSSKGNKIMLADPHT